MISAVIPVRDGARYLEEAIASLEAQTLPPGELIVVDDGSTDDSAAVAEAAGATVIRTHGKGPGAARNAGAAAATGDLLAFLDADDIAVPDRFARQLAAITGRDAVFGAVRTFLSPDRPDLRLEVPPVQAAPHVGAMLIWREVFITTGGFDPGLAAAEFIEWFDRASLDSVMLDAVVLERRLHGDNLTLRADRTAYAHAARAAILRRRLTG